MTHFDARKERVCAKRAKDSRLERTNTHKTTHVQLEMRNKKKKKHRTQNNKVYNIVVTFFARSSPTRGNVVFTNLPGDSGEAVTV